MNQWLIFVGVLLILNSCAHCEYCRVRDTIWKGTDSLRTVTILEKYCGLDIDDVKNTTANLKDKTDTSLTIIRKITCP